MDRLALGVRKLIHGNESARARRWQALAATGRDVAASAELQRFEATMRTEPEQGRVLLARARTAAGTPFWAGLSIEQLLGMHMSIAGATGTGKTFLALALVLQILEHGRYPVIVLDLKGELSELLLEVVVPALASTEIGPELLAHLRVVRPFDKSHLPLLRITEAEEGIPREVQAYNLAATLEEATGEDLGGRMRRLLLRLTSLAIELNEPLPLIKTWLAHPSAFAAAARRSSDPETRAFAHSEFAKENRLSMEALAARLDTFLFLAETRLALGAPSCLSFSMCLRQGLSVLDLGNPPAGAEQVQRFWAGMLVGRLTRAILSREVDDDSPPVLVVLEEFQEALGRHQVEQFARLLSQSRFKRIACQFLNQQATQVAAVSPALLRALQTNTNLVAIFRSNLEDARALAHALPTPREKRGDRPSRETLVEELTRLPDRMFYLWMKQAPFRAQLVRSPRLDLEDLRERARRVPADVRATIRQGTVAVRREELVRAVAAEERRRRDTRTTPDEILVPRPERLAGSNLPELG